MRKLKYKAPPASPEYYRERRRTIHGILLQAHRDIRMRCEGRRPPNEAKLFKGLPYSAKEEFLAWARNDRGFLLCYKQWVLSGYNKKLTPVITRINNKRGYTLDNIEYLSRSANSAFVRSSYDRVKEMEIIRKVCNVKT